MVHSDSEAESLASQHSQDSVVSFSQKFEPQEDDEETLWEVEKITAERGQLYKVKWKGIDPKTMKPWTQSWVPKKDCTPDLVTAWKKDKKVKERRKSTASNRGRDSAASKRSGRTTTVSVVISKASTSKASDGRRSASTINAGADEEITAARRGRSSATSTRMASTSSPSNNRTRSKSALGLIPDITSYSEEEEHPPPKTNAKGKKRKLAEANSATNSANVPIDVNVNKEGDAIEKRVVARPTKKRKIEVETIKPEPESEEVQRRSLSISQTQSHSQPQPTQEEESYEVSKPRGKVADDEDAEEVEEDERMVEDALSQGINSPTPIHEQEDKPDEDQRLYTHKGKGREMPEIQESEVDELEEDSVIVISQPSKPKKKNSVNSKSTGKAMPETVATSDIVNTKGKPTKNSKSKIEIVPESSKYQSLPPSPKFGPPSRRSLAKTKAMSSGTPLPASTSATVIPKRKSTTNASRYPRMQTTKSNRPIRHATPPSESGSDTDSGPPRLVESSPHSSQRPPTEERSVFWSGPPDVSPVLSPAALERLRLFDEEVDNGPGPFKAYQEQQEETPLSRRAAQGEEGQSKENPGVHVGHKHQQVIDLVSPEGTPAPSSKAFHRPKASGGNNGESERDQKGENEANIFLPNESSALMMASRPRQFEDRPTGVVVHNSSPPLADLGLESRSATDKPTKEPNPGHNNATSKSKSTSSSSSTMTVPGNGNHRLRSAKPSNIIEIIPETEEEGSQSQSQPLDLDRPTPVPTPCVSYPQPPTTPGGRNTLRSRMKPRTPLSRSPSMVSHSREERPLGPIPELPPSVFHPHLPEPISSLLESITDAPTSDRRKNEEDATVSSIEDFDSPEKKRKPNARAKTTVTRKDLIPSKERQKESAENIWESDVVKRGQEIAEAAKKNSEFQLCLTHRPKKTLDEIRASRSRSGSNVSQLQRGFDLTHDKIMEEDEEMQDASTAVVPPASGPRNTLEEESLTLQEMEEAYVDLNGGAEDHHIRDSNTPDPVALRQEEEESTQDLMMEIAEQRMKGIEVAGGPLDTVIPESSLQKKITTDTPVNGEGDELEIPKIVVQDASQSGSPHPYSSEDGSRVGNMRTTRSRSRSQTPSLASQAIKGKGKAKMEISTKKSGRTGPLAPSRHTSPSPNNHQAEYNNNIQERLDAVLALVNTKSNDVARLEAELSSEKIKNEELQAKADTQYQAMLEIIDVTTKEFSRSSEAMKQEVKDTETRLAELLAEKVEWEAERARLTAEVESAKQSKLSAEKDREFFREQYAKASGFVSSIRDENKDLQKRIKIAEEQATSGVSFIKSTFELRVKSLETDVGSWRKMAEFLMDKDRRTENDELRRRAGEHPELLARCARQESNLEELQEQIEDLNTEVEQQQRGWSVSKAELEGWKKEFAVMHLELTEATAKLERLGREGVDASSVRAEDNGHEFVYSCRWRTHDGIESTSCREVFSTISGLEQHLLTGGHLDT